MDLRTNEVNLTMPNLKEGCKKNIEYGNIINMIEGFQAKLNSL